MPRIGVSLPVTSQAAVFFAYGHFTQMPPLGDIFSNANYSVLSELQAGSEDRFGVLGNPDIKPERTVQYQFGYRQGIADLFGVDVTLFYKDIRDLLGVEFVSTYTGAEYPRLTNVDFGNVLGVTVALDQRPIGPFTSSLDYTWQTAQGNSSDPRETATREAAGEDPRPRQVPLNWDQRHTLNLTLEMSRANRYSAGAILRIGSGQPYTPTIASGFGGGLEANSGRKPAGMVLDVRGERQFGLGGLSLGVVGRVFNVFDTRFFNGFVFPSTGSPFYSRDVGSDRSQLLDPSRFYGPRRFELGLSFAPETKP
jgi:outer membrane receptor protein involved in Fe transport